MKDIIHINYLTTNESKLSEFHDITVTAEEELGRLIKGHLFTSDRINAENFKFVCVEPDSSYGLHNAKEVMLVITLSGQIKTEPTKGPARIFGAGDIVLVNESLDGHGHKTTIISKQQWKAILITINSLELTKILNSLTC